MITSKQKNVIFNHLIELLELPDSSYEKAARRYEDIGKWLNRSSSACRHNDPHIFPQGSFRLGTAIRPIDDNEEYDLDLACDLRTGITKHNYTQKQLKLLVGNEIESYRLARGISSPIEEKPRCWRLEYKDDLSFHMDIVPCIPESENIRRRIYSSVLNSGESSTLSNEVARQTVAITDNQHPGYRYIQDEWNVSNPEGYAIWFEDRMKQNIGTKRLMEAQINDLPVYNRKTPLQRVIQLLKRHRDQMYKNDDDSKPISVIITTLTAKAYQGENDIESAMSAILSRMGKFVNTFAPKVPNPTNPIEDFADRWYMQKYSHLKLEENFWYWLGQAQEDFGVYGSTNNVRQLSEHTMNKFSVNMNESLLATTLASASQSNLLSQPVTNNGMSFPDKKVVPKKSGGFA